MSIIVLYLRYWSRGRYGELYAYFHSGDSLLSEHAATTNPGMPPKRARRTVAAADAASEEESASSAPGVGGAT